MTVVQGVEGCVTVVQGVEGGLTVVQDVSGRPAHPGAVSGCGGWPLLPPVRAQCEAAP